MAYSIIMNHKGKIDVFSKEGKGSRFLIYIPSSKNNSVLITTQGIQGLTWMRRGIVKRLKEWVRDNIEKEFRI